MSRTVCEYYCRFWGYLCGYYTLHSYYLIVNSFFSNNSDLSQLIIIIVNSNITQYCIHKIHLQLFDGSTVMICCNLINLFIRGTTFRSNKLFCLLLTWSCRLFTSVITPFSFWYTPSTTVFVFQEKTINYLELAKNRCYMSSMIVNTIVNWLFRTTFRGCNW